MDVNRKYINAVFNFDVETFKTLLNTEPFDKSLLSDIKFANDAPCPIYRITQCWEIIFEHPEDWNENYRGVIAENKKRNLEIKQIFTDIYNVDFKPIDFYNTNFCFFRDERDATCEDVFVGESRNELMAKGYRGIDIDLYVAVNKFDFAEVEKLLETGANPACRFSDDTDCIGRISIECSFLETELQDIIIYNKHHSPTDNDVQALIDLIGLATHESMYSLLSKYNLNKND